MPPVRKKLGDILLEMGALDAHQLRSALGHQQQWGMPLGQALIERSLCTPQQVLQALAVQLGLELVDLDRVEPAPALTAALPLKVAQMARAVPLEVRGGRGEVLVVAVAAPASLQQLDLVRSGSGKPRIVPKLASDDAIERAIGRLYLGLRPEPGREPPAAKALRTLRADEEARIELDTGVQVRRSGTAAGAVLLLGWSEQVGEALRTTLRQGGVEARIALEDEALACRDQDVLVTSTLTLEMLLAPGQRLRGRVIICGMPESADMVDARALGARIYLAPPFSSAQLLDAIQRCRATGAAPR